MKLISTLCLFSIGTLIATGCVKRECTDEEREEAGADSNDDCIKLVPLHTFTAKKAESRSVDWSSGTDLEIKGHIRSISIVKGDADDSVTVSYKAQVDLAQDRTQDVVDKTMDHLTTSLSHKGGAIVVGADRGSSKSNLGAAIVVELPPSFDSDLTIDKGEQPGDVALEFLGNTRNLNVDMNALGADLHVADATNLLRATINTDGEIQITDGFASLEAAAVHSAFGDIGVRFKAVPVSHARVLADFGDLTVILPGDGDFTLTGTAERGVSTGNAPAGCSSSSSPSPKSMECNAGDPDGLTFELRASGEIQLGYE